MVSWMELGGGAPVENAADAPFCRTYTRLETSLQSAVCVRKWCVRGEVVSRRMLVVVVVVVVVDDAVNW